MSIYDKAHELAAELKKCDEVINLKEASKSIQQSKTNIKIIDDFRSVQMDAYSEQMKNGKVSDETMKKFNDIADIIANNRSVNEYVQAEQKFSVMWQDILKILNDAIGIDFSFGLDKDKK
ncbi:YlbF family regulator [Clostridium sp. cel8]|jgi:cell fate (sporulation/competence/biofilm development) regulator YlbF (YheA/YmcA/DUF963 family)|uniref:YlbF family regulator n=1 Tax=unclassified Clostridium TaxID=2614128 RepID=UPI0015F3EB40|nr:YlbF family regulator [Clostridium sp. cel8]MBA5850561.1 YlbF family regulator [Clostridium sp. cel8]